MMLAIEASAGTGKTTELTRIVSAAICGPGAAAGKTCGSGVTETPEFAALLEKGLLDPRSIVLTTFTEAAASELHGRVRAELGAQRDIDAMPINTIHGFCAGLLKEYAFEMGASGAARDVVSESTLAEELAMRWWSEHARDDRRRAELLRSASIDRRALVQIARQGLSSRGVVLVEVEGDGIDAIVLELMSFARREASALCAARGVMTFQDQILLVRNAIRSSPRLKEALRQRYRLGVIDEAQDTDPLQMEIFSQIFDGDASSSDSDRLLIVVGDPKQSIYAFRGADLDAYLRMRGSTPPLRLGVNWRSEARLVDAINQLFSRAHPFLRDGIDHPPVQPAPTVRHGALSGDVPAPIEIHHGAPGETPEEWTVRTLHELMARGLTIDKSESTSRAIEWSDIAVLGRANRKLAMLDERLRSAGIPTVLLGDRNVFDSDAVVELSALLDACAEPGRIRVVRRAMLSPLVGIAAEQLSPMWSRSAAHSIVNGAEADPLVGEWSARFAQWAQAAQRGGVLGIVERALEQSSSRVSARLATDVLHLAELVHAAAGAGADVAVLVATLERLTAMHADDETVPGDPHRRRVDQEQGVTLQTIHNSKGLEYGIVLVPWCGDAVVSRSTTRGGALRVSSDRVGELSARYRAPAGTAPRETLFAPLPREDTPGALVEQRAREESVRLLYVAVTRARHAVAAFVESKQASAAECVLDLVEAPSGTERRASDARGPLRDAQPGESKSRWRRQWRAPSRPLRLWIDTNFTRLSGSAEGTTVEALAVPAALGVRDDEPAPVVTREEISGGLSLGRLVHRIFEWAAIEGPSADLEAIVAAALAETGDSARDDAALLVSMVRHVRDADLSVASGPEMTLASLNPVDCAAELKFCLPLGHGTRFTPEALADALRRAPPDSPAARFAPEAERLHFGSIAGFLSGSVDLLFKHGAEWWIVDYKTNHLGTADEDYRGERLVDAMVHGHYVLQYLLYTVAARRLLGLRGIDTRGAGFGGVIYPFVRGVDPREPGRGLFVDRPAESVIEAIDELCRGAAP